MSADLIAILIMLPVTVVVIFACVHEYRRYKSEGRATYGLAYDESTGTTYLTGIGEDDEAYDPEDFDPAGYDEAREAAEASDETRG